MYFTAFFLESREHRVIPYKWVRGINYENTINNGLYKNKQFRAFYTNDPNAFNSNEAPQTFYVPDPNASGTVFPNPGWYLCKLRKFKGIKVNIFYSC